MIGLGMLMMAILVPVFGRARRVARVAQVGGQLRQIGQARTLYMSDNDDLPLYRTGPLVRTGAIPSALLLNPLDPNPKGFEEMALNWGQSANARKSSYIELGSWIGPVIYDIFEARQGAGWIVAPHFDNHWDVHTSHFPTGKYTRLLIDGGVVRRDYREARGASFSAEAVFMDDKRSLFDEADARL